MMRRLTLQNARYFACQPSNLQQPASSTSRSSSTNSAHGGRGSRHSRNRGPQQQPSRSPHVTKQWETSTCDLIQLPQWTPGHKRKAQACFEHWSRQKLSFGRSSNNNSNNHKMDMIVQLWLRTQHEIPQQETAAAMYDYAILALAKHGFAAEALAAFETYLKTTFRIRGDRHTPSSYHLRAVLQALSRSGQAERAEELLLQMYEQLKEKDGTVATIEPNVFSVTSVLDGWSRLGQGHRAQALLDDCITNRGLEATVVCYNAVLAAWSRTRDGENIRKRAQHIMETMPVPPDALSWSSYLVACRDPTDMETVLWEAFRNSEPVNAVCFNVVLNAWGNAGAVQRAEDFLTSWIALIANDNSGSNSIPQDLWPRISSFNTLLNSLAKTGDDEKVKYWLAEMERLGVVPDDISYNCWILALAHRGKAQEAEEVFERVGQDMDWKNQAYACNTILSGWGNHARHIEYNNGIIDRATAFAKRSQERGLVHSIITYNALLKVMAACGEPELAEDLLREMKNGLVKPDIVSYSIVVDAYAKARRPEEAHEIHRFMTVPPNVVSFNSLIHAYSKSDAPESAERANSVLKEMADTAVSPDLMTYCSLLTVWSNTNHIDKARSARTVLDSMVASYRDLAPLHRNAHDLLRNAQTMVVAACAYLPQTVDYPAEDLERTHQIARQTYGEIQHPTFVTYATYMLALHRLETDEKMMIRSVREVFLSYCQQERNSEMNALVLRRLKMVIPAQLLHAEILQEGQRMLSETLGEQSKKR